MPDIDAFAYVFPAYAGMSRPRRLGDLGCVGFPRLRGDEPAGSNLVDVAAGFSPPTRG